MEGFLANGGCDPNCIVERNFAVRRWSGSRVGYGSWWRIRRGRK